MWHHNRPGTIKVVVFKDCGKPTLHHTHLSPTTEKFLGIYNLSQVSIHPGTVLAAMLPCWNRASLMKILYKKNYVGLWTHTSSKQLQRQTQALFWRKIKPKPVLTCHKLKYSLVVQWLSRYLFIKFSNCLALNFSPNILVQLYRENKFSLILFKEIRRYSVLFSHACPIF